jgi:hypothetical protein
MTKPYCPKLFGWHVFNDCEIQRDDEAAMFPDDDAVLAHIELCSDCASRLGKKLAVDLIASKSYGYWTIETNIHFAGKVSLDDFPDEESGT